LREVFRVVRGARKSVANIEDAPVEALDDFLPRGSIASYAATDQGSWGNSSSGTLNLGY
jgi:hypothetical protein